MKKLYRVETSYYVMAENREDARTVRPRFLDLDLDVSIEEATSVDYSWRDAIPFEADGDKTCGEILKEQQRAAK